MIHRVASVAVLALAFALPGAALGQMDEIVVTATRASGEDYSTIPAVTLQRRADFLVQRIRLVNDTRSEELRKSELYQTIRGLLSDSAKRPGIALSYGTDFLLPITERNFEVPLDSGGKRSDTSSTTIYVKLALGATENVSPAMAGLAAFIKGARLVGRTEIAPEGDVSLSLVGPEKYRYQIISKIAEDARKLQATVAAKCRVHITGLAKRVSWQRSDLAELTLYIPYNVDLTDCE